jgi:hypothetical protein
MSRSGSRRRRWFWKRLRARASSAPGVEREAIRHAYSYPRTTEDWTYHLHALAGHLLVVAPDVSGERTQVALALCACGYFDYVLELGGRSATAAEHVISMGVETFEFLPLPRLTVRVVEHGS